MVNFPAPVGGTPLPVDWAPSILFAVLYAILFPWVIYRGINRRSRTLLLSGTMLFSIERVVFFSLRAVQAHSEPQRLSPGLTTYMQSSLGMGFIGIANDLVSILRCLLVNPTYGPATYFQSPGATTKGYVIEPPSSDTPDQPVVRNGIRQGMGFLGLAFLGASLPGILANTKYNKALTDQRSADSTALLRYISTAVALPLTWATAICAAWGARQFSERVSKQGVNVIFSVVTLMSIVALYRLPVMKDKTDSLSAPSSLNTHGAKAEFYVFHILPEWLATVTLLGCNVRETFGTGVLGDWRSQDETEKQKQKRLEKEAKRLRRTERPHLQGSAHYELNDRVRGA